MVGAASSCGVAISPGSCGAVGSSGDAGDSSDDTSGSAGDASASSSEVVATCGSSDGAFDSTGSSSVVVTSSDSSSSGVFGGAAYRWFGGTARGRSSSRVDSVVIDRVEIWRRGGMSGMSLIQE